MPTDTCIITNADVAAAEFAAAERTDAAPSLPSMSSYLPDVPLPAERRAAPRRGRPADVLRYIARQERMRLDDMGGADARELMSRCRAAAGMTGGAYADADRADVAAELAARHIGTLPSMSKLCGDALNLYRKVQRRRAELKANELETHAATVAAPTYLVERAERERAAELLRRRAAAKDAAAATTRLARKLGLKGAAIADGEVWSALYRWMRPGRTDEECAQERGVSASVFTRRAQRGAVLVRATYSGTALLRALGMGTLAAAEHTRERPAELAPVTLSRTLSDACTLIGGEDFTREAHGRTPLLNVARPDVRDVAASDVAEVRIIGPTLRPVERTPDVKRAAMRDARRRYAERMLAAGQGANLAAEQDRAPRRTHAESELAETLGRVTY